MQPGRQNAERVHRKTGQQADAEELPGVAAASGDGAAAEGAEDRPLAQQRIEQHEQIDADHGKIHEKEERRRVGDPEALDRKADEEIAGDLTEQHDKQCDQADGPDHVADGSAFFLCFRSGLDGQGRVVLFVHVLPPV